MTLTVLSNDVRRKRVNRAEQEKFACRSDINKKRSAKRDRADRPEQLTGQEFTSPKTAATVDGAGPELSRKSEAPEDAIPVCLTFDNHPCASTTAEQEECEGYEGLSIRQPLESASAPTLVSTVTSTPLSSPSICFPAYIKPLPDSLELQDLNYLRSKGAFDLPEENLRIEILRSYMLGVHVFMPILNLRETLQTIAANDGQKRISLLLFQAIMFAGVAHLPDDSVHDTGFVTLKEARKEYFTRVRLLHDLDIEQDDLAVLQTLLLMSFEYEKWDKRRHTWYWSGLALSQAQSMALNSSSSAPSLPPETQMLHRRLWWSLYIRDRLIGLGLRRPMRIKDSDFDVKPLDMHAFDTSAFKIDFTTSAGQVYIQQDSNLAHLCALCCIELAKLCVCIGHILSTQYTVLGQRTEMTKSMIVAPRPLEERLSSLSRCDEELRTWYEVLEPQLRPFALSRGSDISKACSEVHWPILHMIYRTAIVVLHRPHMLQRQVGQIKDAAGQALSREKVKAAACTLTRITQTIYQQGHFHLLPTSAVSALLAASLAHLSTLKSSDEDARDASAYRFCQSSQLLQELRNTYASADSAVAFLGMTVRKAGLSLLMPLSQLRSYHLASSPRKERAARKAHLRHERLPSLPLSAGSDLNPVIMSGHMSAESSSNISGTQTGCINSDMAAVPPALTRTSSPITISQLDSSLQHTFSTWVDDDPSFGFDETLSMLETSAPRHCTFHYDADPFPPWEPT
ncbi:Cutinase transcription factor 1 beta [Cyphellophora attinorum]|uniref:Cutinase transcription factor 1 beta n=1 Tax=Cyphellophora attinorum TaxID=1664694 RepID=A0A0N1HSV5_9EURO|nr:Cutinase transcription factor 1 beta [Phialophora attinorum]KPI41827.1 Cutinase transcription factor 1 beta [Phialophora attinorum]